MSLQVVCARFHRVLQALGSPAPLLPTLSSSLEEEGRVGPSLQTSGLVSSEVSSVTSLWTAVSAQQSLTEVALRIEGSFSLGDSSSLHGTRATDSPPWPEPSPGNGESSLGAAVSVEGEGRPLSGPGLRTQRPQVHSVTQALF